MGFKVGLMGNKLTVTPTLSKFGHFCSLYDASVNSAVSIL